MLSKKIVQDLVKGSRPKFVEPGSYFGYINFVEQRENEKGTIWIAIGCNSDEIGKVYLRYFFTEKAAKRAFRELQDLAREFGLTIDLEEFQVRDLEYLCELFGQFCGKEVVINISGNVGNYNYKLNKVD